MTGRVREVQSRKVTAIAAWETVHGKSMVELRAGDLQIILRHSTEMRGTLCKEVRYDD